MNTYNKDWLKNLDDSLSLSSLTIPGTHNSCAKLFLPYGRCQSLNIEEQLNLGLRFLDIRCRHINDGFNMHHDIYYLKSSFDDVLNSCLGFLQNNPSEFIILSIKEEYKPKNNTHSFEETLISYIKPHKDKFFLENRLPLLSELRGKILIFSRYGDNTIGIDASDWNEHLKADNKTNIQVQDNYNIKAFKKDKWQDVKAHILRANKNPNDKKLFLNFVSGTNFTYFDMPKINAKNTNSKLYGFIKYKKKLRLGIIILDYPELPNKDLTKKIINLNF